MKKLLACVLLACLLTGLWGCSLRTAAPTEAAPAVPMPTRPAMQLPDLHLTELDTYTDRCRQVLPGMDAKLAMPAGPRSVSHRGYNSAAPENTLPAFRLAASMGFEYVETDVSFTSDGVAVLLHDDIIDRTSNGTGFLCYTSFDTVRSYDFGAWFDPVYAGTQIPTFEEFIALCAELGLKPYIELKSGGMTSAQVEGLLDTVRAYGLEQDATWISFRFSYLCMVRDLAPQARLGYLCFHPDAELMEKVETLRTGQNEVFLDADISNPYPEDAPGYGLDVEGWTLENDIAALMDPRYTGFTTNGDILPLAQLRAAALKP